MLNMDGVVHYFVEKANNLSLNGLLILQSVLLAPAIEFICRRLVYLEGASKPVLRDGAPMKAYTALSLNVDALQNAWGPCLEPALQQVSINFDKLLTRGLLLAPGNQVWMQWYDKLRQMRHGPVYIQAREWTTAVLVSLDPHTEEDRIEIGINDLAARWYHGVLKLKGDVEVVIFPLTKFYACPVLSFAGFEVDAHFEWLCKKGVQATSFHHADDMNEFKSLGFNLGLKMKIHRTAQSTCSNNNQPEAVPPSN